MRLKAGSGRKGHAGHARGFRKDDEARLADTQRLEEVSSRPVSSLDLGDVYHSRRAVKALEKAGMASVGELVKLFGPDPPHVLRVGDLTRERIRRQLGELGLLPVATPEIVVTKEGNIRTNLSPAQLHTLLRLAKLELAELREDLQPHRIKVIGELLDLIKVPDKL